MKNFNKIEMIGFVMYLIGACFLGGDEILKPLLFLVPGTIVLGIGYVCRKHSSNKKENAADKKAA